MHVLVGDHARFCLFFVRTFKQDCPVHIALKANEDGSALCVRSVNYEHNHPISKVKLPANNGDMLLLFEIGAVRAPSSKQSSLKRSKGQSYLPSGGEGQQKNHSARVVS